MMSDILLFAFGLCTLALVAWIFWVGVCRDFLPTRNDLAQEILLRMVCFPLTESGLGENIPKKMASQAFWLADEFLAKAKEMKP